MSTIRLVMAAVAVSISATIGIAHAEPLKPFVLGDTPPGDMARVVVVVKSSLQAKGFEVVGSYSPYANATVICATNAELKEAAAKAENGGFGVAQRVAVTLLDGKIQVSYVNPAYIGTAYGLGKLESTAQALKSALGHRFEYGSKGIEEDQLKPGSYHYSVGMPYFQNIDVMAKHADYKTAVDIVEKNLASKKGGTQKVYRIDLPGKEISVFGVGIIAGDGVDKGDKDTDKEIMDTIDFQDPRSTAYLPYELMVVENQVMALRGRYRIAVNFPDLSMAGKHGFTKIMSAPGGIKAALTAVSRP